MRRSVRCAAAAAALLPVILGALAPAVHADPVDPHGAQVVTGRLNRSLLSVVDLTVRAATGTRTGRLWQHHADAMVLARWHLLLPELRGTLRPGPGRAPGDPGRSGAARETMTESAVPHARRRPSRRYRTPVDQAGRCVAPSGGSVKRLADAPPQRPWTVRHTTRPQLTANVR